MAKRKPQHDPRLIGNWKSDRKRTLQHCKPKKFASPQERKEFLNSFGSMEVHWTPEKCLKHVKCDCWPLDYEIVSIDKNRVVVKLCDFGGWTHQEKIQFVDSDTYCVARDNFWEYFKRVGRKPSATSRKKKTATQNPKHPESRPDDFEQFATPKVQFFTKAKRLSDKTAIIRDLGDPLAMMLDEEPVRFSLVVYELPEVSLPSGRVCASDGFVMQDQPFTRKIKPGRYPVQLVAAKFKGDERIAFARLQFARRPIAKWEMAVTKGQNLRKLKNDDVFSYGVDAGIGCFCDSFAGKLLEPTEDFQQWFSYNKRVVAEMRKVFKPTRDWVRIDTANGSAALFSSGFGDGHYASYFGLDKADRPVALMTDFQIVNWPRRPIYR